MNDLIIVKAEYIKSYSAVNLIEAEYEVALFNNFSNSDLSATICLEKIDGRKFAYEVVAQREKFAYLFCES
jgi:hypothetical protein